MQMFMSYLAEKRRPRFQSAQSGIASEAKQSIGCEKRLDSFEAHAPAMTGALTPSA
jgi:hypothetical protein